MASATFIAVFFVPLFYVLVRGTFGRRPRRAPVPQTGVGV